MKISELMYDLRDLKNKHGDMDLYLHIDKGNDDYVVFSCGHFTHENESGKRKNHFAVLGIGKRDELIKQDATIFTDQFRQQIEEKYINGKVVL